MKDDERCHISRKIVFQMNLREAELHHTNNLPVPWMLVAIGTFARLETSSNLQLETDLAKFFLDDLV